MPTKKIHIKNFGGKTVIYRQLACGLTIYVNKDIFIYNNDIVKLITVFRCFSYTFF